MKEDKELHAGAEILPGHHAGWIKEIIELGEAHRRGREEVGHGH